MQLTLELPASSPILPNPSLNDTEALEQTSALQIPVTVVLALKDLPSCRSHKPGRLCVLGQGNGFLDMHIKGQHQKRLYKLAKAKLRKNNIDTLLRLHLCAVGCFRVIPQIR
jgi:hypothetical protein